MELIREQKITWRKQMRNIPMFNERIQYVALGCLCIIIPLTQDGGIPLYFASCMGRSDVVNVLIRNGADVNLALNVIWRCNVAYTHTV